MGFDQTIYFLHFGVFWIRASFSNGHGKHFYPFFCLCKYLSSVVLTLSVFLLILLNWQLRVFQIIPAAAGGRMALFAPKSYMLELFPAIKVRFNGKYPNSLLAYYYPYIQADFYSAAGSSSCPKRAHTALFDFYRSSWWNKTCQSSRVITTNPEHMC